MAKRKTKKKPSARPKPPASATDGIHPGLLDVQVVELSKLVLDPDNARAHGERSLEAIAASAARFKQRKPLVVRRSDMKVIAGNGFAESAVARGWTHAAVVFVDDDDDTAKAYALADNRTAELSSWNEQRLAEQLASFNGTDVLDALGWTESEIDSLLRETNLAGDDDEDEDDGSAREGMTYRVLIDCTSESHQRELLERFEKEGLPCKAVMS